MLPTAAWVLPLGTLLVLLAGCSDRSPDLDDHAVDPPQPSLSGPTVAPTRTPGIDYPDPLLTPGDTLPATVEEICISGYSKTVRAVTSATRKQVYASYGIDPATYGEHELDHLIPLAIGGSNEPANLWPEPDRTSFGFRDKDRLENTLRSLVCSGRLNLAQAQREIAADWYAAYRNYVKKQ